MTVFIDTSVIMYAAGAEHPHREACRAVLRRVADGSLDAVTSTEVVQEILHRFARGDREIGVAMARGVLDLFDRLLPVDTPSVRGAVELYTGTPRLSARDVLHVATCAAHDIREIVSIDVGFDDAAAVVRRSPEDLARDA